MRNKRWRALGGSNPMNAIYANRERIDQVEALGVLCENGLKYAWYNVSKERELELFRGKPSDQ